MQRTSLVIVLTAVVAAAVAFSDIVRAQQPPFKADVTLVALQVTVRSGAGLVTGLAADNFAVYEDGVQQQLEFFETGKVGMDVTLLLDTSSSMVGRLIGAQEAAVRFMTALRSGDRGAVVGFNQRFAVLQSLTEDGEAIDRAIRSTRPSGATSLLDSVYIALRQAVGTRAAPGELRREAIVVLSDGNDTASKVDFDVVLTLARNSGANLYIVTLRPPRTAAPLVAADPTADFDLKRLARDTGADAYFADEVTALRPIFESIAAELTAKYSLAYRPANTAAYNRFRQIEVRVVSHPDYRARARAGYTTDAPAAATAQSR